VTVVPLAEARPRARPRRDTVDCLITRSSSRAVRSAKEFYTNLRRETRCSSSQWRSCRGELSAPGRAPVFEPFAKIGLLFTKNLDRIRDA